MSESVSRPKSLLAQTKTLLRRNELHARKSLGQHFLVDSAVLSKILETAGLTANDLVMEIGPGIGVLTGELVKSAGWVIAVELDKDLAGLLEQTLLPAQNFSVINRDILDIDPLELIEAESSRTPRLSEIFRAGGEDDTTAGFRPRYKLVANLPYYITQPIIRHFSETGLKPEVMVLMVQKEVAENIAAAPGDLGILAVSVQLYGRPEIISTVPAQSFYPVPKVDSAILKITTYSRPAVQIIGAATFFKVVRAGFCARRKQVANALSQGLRIPRDEVLALMQEAGVSPLKRAEALTLSDWSSLEKVFVEGKKI